MSLDAMKQALEALELWSPASGHALNKRAEAVVALRAAIKEAQHSETEAELYKRLYELRGKALERPCLNCGHQPAKIKAMAQPEQEPVAWMHPSWIDPDTRGWASDSFNAIPIEGWVPVYTAPRQWQGLMEDEIVGLTCECVDDETFNMDCALDFARAIEAKLKEKNT